MVWERGRQQTKEDKANKTNDVRGGEGRQRQREEGERKKIIDG